MSDKYEGVSYRGIVLDRTSFDKFKSLAKGDEYLEKGFMSTSLSKLVSDDFASGTEYKAVFEIKGKKGVDVSSISDLQEEKEILFDKMSKFIIKKIRISDKSKYGNLYIYLDEI